MLILLTNGTKDTMQNKDKIIKMFDERFLTYVGILSY